MDVFKFHIGGAAGQLHVSEVPETADAQLSGDTRTLRDTLLQRGVFTAAQSQTSADMVTSQRK